MDARVDTLEDIVAAVETLPVPRPFTLKRFVQAIGDYQSKPIELVGELLGGTAPCGWLVRTSEVDYLCYPTNTSWSHQLHVVLHEVGHVVLGHVGDALSLAHARCDADVERAAETFAMMAARRIAHVLQVVDWKVPERDDVAALGAVFDGHSVTADGS